MRGGRQPADRLGELFIVGFEGTRPDRELLDLLRHHPPGGVILFKRNLEDPEQIRRLTDGIRGTLSTDPLVGIDQEGGRVWRLPAPFTRLPAAAALGETGLDSLAASAAGVIARELAAVGINCTFAPVLDLHTRPDNPVIGDRAIGEDPVLVTRLARAFLLGLRANGIAGCGKHFPGHGETSLDSHRTLPTVGLDWRRLLSVEIAPYRTLCRDPRRPLEMVMTAHVLYPELDPTRPATFSPVILGKILRRELGFDGLIITDDLEMGAVTESHGPEEAALLAFRAGADLLLFCHTPTLLPRCVQTLRRALERNEISPRRVRRSLERIRRFKHRLHRRFPPQECRRVLFNRIGSEAHLAVAAALEARHGRTP